MRELVFRERMTLNPARIERIYRDLGDREADRMVCDATEALALALARIGRAYRRGDLDGVSEQAAELAASAEFLGLAKLTRVAGDVVCCAAQGPGPALDATLARLGRIGDGALVAIWDPRDIIS